MPTEYPLILTPVQAAELLQISLATLYRWSSEDRLKGAVRRGKPLRFHRDRLIERFFAENPAKKRWRSPMDSGTVPTPQGAPP